jgi:hypothetical protein
MKPEGSLPHSQVAVTCPYPDPAQPNPSPTSYFLKIHLNIILLHLGLPSGLFPSGFPTKTLCTPLLSPIRATCPAHLIILDFITRTIVDLYRFIKKSIQLFELHYTSCINVRVNVKKIYKQHRNRTEIWGIASLFLTLHLRQKSSNAEDCNWMQLGSLMNFRCSVGCRRDACEGFVEN